MCLSPPHVRTSGCAKKSVFTISSRDTSIYKSSVRKMTSKIRHDFFDLHSGPFFGFFALFRKNDFLMNFYKNFFYFLKIYFFFFIFLKIYFYKNSKTRFSRKWRFCAFSLFRRKRRKGGKGRKEGKGGNWDDIDTVKNRR